MEGDLGRELCTPNAANVKFYSKPTPASVWYNSIKTILENPSLTRVNTVDTDSHTPGTRGRIEVPKSLTSRHDHPTPGFKKQGDYRTTTVREWTSSTPRDSVESTLSSSGEGRGGNGWYETDFYPVVTTVL